MAEPNREQLQQKRKRIQNLLWVSSALFVLSLAGFIWGLRDWLSPSVATGDAWMLPACFISLVTYSGAVLFGVQELREVARQMKKQVEYRSNSGI